MYSVRKIYIFKRTNNKYVMKQIITVLKNSRQSSAICWLKMELTIISEIIWIKYTEYQFNLLRD